MRRMIPLLLLALFVFGMEANAENFSGEWLMNANGWKIDVDIKQRGSSITGKMYPHATGKATSSINGEVRGRKITFQRSGDPDVPGVQEFEGFLFQRGSRKEMAGIFSHAKRWEYGWYAKRK